VFEYRSHGERELRKVVFSEKDLDMIAGPVLYNTVRAIIKIGEVRRKLSMLTSRTYKEHAAKWQPSAAMRSLCPRVGLTCSSVNIFGGRLGQETAIDSRNIRH